MRMRDMSDDGEQGKRLYAHLYRVDFYGAPAWAFWVVCVAVGVICGILLGSQ
jgi:hypothetical protein